MSAGQIREIVGDLLTVEADYIAHQANCVSVGSHGLAAAIFAKWPETDCYARRRAGDRRDVAAPTWRDAPGTIAIYGRVVHMFAQWAPGRVGQYTSYPPPTPHVESKCLRTAWFANCLYCLERDLKRHYQLPNPKFVVAFPRLIGCDLAGGDWGDYRALLIDFAWRVRDVANILIVQLPDRSTATTTSVAPKRAKRAYDNDE